MPEKELKLYCGELATTPSDWTHVGAGDYQHMPFPDESASAVEINYLLERMTEAEAESFVNEVFRAVKPCGIVYVFAWSMPLIVELYWDRRHQERIEVSNEGLSPPAWLDRMFYGSGCKQAIYPEKLHQLFRQFNLFHVDRERDRAIRFTCNKPVHPKCSIVLSTRNKASCLDLSLASIYRQEVPFNFEVIVVDDGSTDGTKEVCRKYPVRYYCLDNPRYRNPSVARNVGYHAARGEVIIPQSDDIIHVSPNTIEFLTTDLKEGEFLLAHVENWVYKDGKPAEYVREYCGPAWPKPYFFLGSLWRKDLYAVGGSDEEFVEPCWDDNWFADCLMKGLGLKPRWTTAVEGHHQSHTHYQQKGQSQNRSYGPETHAKEKESENLYREKVCKAQRTGVYVSTGGAWPMDGVKSPVVAPTSAVITQPACTEPGLYSPKPGCTIADRMSFFWTGERMSWMRWMTLVSFRRYHPDWQIVLYWMREPSGAKAWQSSETQDTQTYRGPDYSNRLDELDVLVTTWTPPRPNLAAAHACDLCQWELLEKGGWYADMDVLWVAPLPRDSVKDASVAFCLSLGFMAIGLVGAAAGSLLIRDIRKSAQDNYSPEKYQCTGAEAVYRLAGVWPDWGHYNHPGEIALERFREQYHLPLVVLPQQTVYPFSYLQTTKIFSEANELPERTCGIHWFGGNNLSQAWNDQITHENFRLYDNTYTHYAAEVLR